MPYAPDYPSRPPTNCVIPDALADVGKAARLECTGQLVALEHARSAARLEHRLERAERRRAAAHAREQGEPAARREHARHRAHPGVRVREKVDGGEAADAVEAMLAE